MYMYVTSYSLQYILHCLAILEKECEQSICLNFWRESKLRRMPLKYLVYTRFLDQLHILRM